MASQTETRQEAAETGGEHGDSARKQYTPPQLVKHGELRSITLGGTPGGGDSGAVDSQNPPES